MATLHIEQWPHAIECGKQRILDAALDAGVPYPHGCASGECGSCKTLVLSGQVTMDRFSPEALSDSERAQGQILACRARCMTDATVRWLSASDSNTAVQTVSMTVSAVVPLAHDVMSLKLSNPGMQFVPGQFAKIKIGSLPARSYSMAGLPSDKDVEFHVRILPNGAVSQHIAKTVRPGEVIQIQSAFGQATWNRSKAPSEQLLLLAGGTGMAPILSILRAALADGFEANRIHVFHGVRTPDDAYNRNLMTELAAKHGFHFTVVCSDRAAEGESTALLHQAVAAQFPKVGKIQVFTAGPPPMVNAIESLGREWGLSADQIQADAFFAADLEDNRAATSLPQNDTSAPKKAGFLKRVMGWR